MTGGGAGGGEERHKRGVTDEEHVFKRYEVEEELLNDIVAGHAGQGKTQKSQQRTGRAASAVCLEAGAQAVGPGRGPTPTPGCSLLWQEEEEESLFKADAVNEEDPERDSATQV